jgi:hypothetical protein
MSEPLTPAGRALAAGLADCEMGHPTATHRIVVIEQEAAARVAPSDGLREAVVVAMENEGVVTWGDDGHRARFLALATTGQREEEHQRLSYNPDFCICGEQWEGHAQPEDTRTADPGGLLVHVNDGSAHDRAMAWSEGHTAGWNEAQDALRDALRAIPATGLVEGANRYDTDDMHVLHVWRDGQSWDINCPRVATDDESALTPEATAPDTRE